MGNHYFDFFPPRSYRKSKNCIPWWHQECLNCYRNNHIACICDQPDADKKCCYCKGIGHYISECPFRLLAEEMVQTRSQHPDNELPDNVLNEFYERARVFMVPNQRTTNKRTNVERSPIRENVAQPSSTHYRDQRVNNDHRPPRHHGKWPAETAANKQQKIGTDHSAYEMVLNDDERTWHQRLLPEHPHFHLVDQNKPRPAPLPRHLRPNRPIYYNDGKSAKVHPNQNGKASTSTGGHTQFGQKAKQMPNRITRSPSPDPWVTDDVEMTHSTAAVPNPNPDPLEEDWDAELRAADRNVIIEEVITTGICNELQRNNVVPVTEEMTIAIGNIIPASQIEIIPADLTVELIDPGPLRNRSPSFNSRATTEASVSMETDDTDSQPTPLQRFSNIVAEINQLNLEEINIQETADYATFIESINKCVNRLHEQLPSSSSTNSLIQTAGDPTNTDNMSRASFQENSNHSGTSNDTMTSDRPSRSRSAHAKLSHCEEPNCGKSFTSPTDLKRHSFVHSGQKPFKCLAPECTRRFAQKSNMMKHVSTCKIRRKDTINLAKLNNTIDKIKNEILARSKANERSNLANPDQDKSSSSEDADKTK